MAKKVENFRVCHEGMGYPVGTVLPPHAFPERPARHIELGALAVTTEPASVDFVPTANVESMPDDELAAENAALRQKLGDLPGENAALRKRADNAEKAIADAAAEVELLKEELAAVKAERDAARGELATFRRKE